MLHAAFYNIWIFLNNKGLKYVGSGKVGLKVDIK
jgi:hypothetical protein